jgi:hypothetical protein
MMVDQATETRPERLQWCKDRALAYLPSSPADAVTSFMSDASKPYGDSDQLIDWTKPAMATLSQLGLMCVMQNDSAAAKRWIEGFN